MVDLLARDLRTAVQVLKGGLHDHPKRRRRTPC
jgi:hypothetical protein